MTDPAKKSEGFQVVPKGEHPCLWMMAGVIAYKLCRRDYQCGTCPLHMEMSQAAGDEERKTFEILHEPLFYSPQHTWVRLKGSRNQPRAEIYTLLVNGQAISLAAPVTAVVGLDDFILRLLSRIEAMTLPPLGTPLARGSPLAKLFQACGDFLVASPLSGKILRVNTDLINRPALLFRNPARGWLAHLRPTNLVAETRDLLDSDGALAWQQRESRKLETLLGTLGKEDRERLGATMPDGHGGADALLRIVGGEHYRRLVLSFLQGEGD